MFGSSELAVELLAYAQPVKGLTDQLQVLVPQLVVAVVLFMVTTVLGQTGLVAVKTG
jgi:hypothetical protein